MRKAALTTLVLALSFTCHSCRPTNYYFENLYIDSNFRLLPMGPRLSVEPTQASYYFIMHTGSGLTLVDHFGRKSGAAQRTRFLYLEGDQDQKLGRTVKQDEILKGTFGTIYANKTCFYSRTVAIAQSSVSVGAHFNQLAHEVPLELSGPPATLPPLTSLSLVRIFRTDPAYIVVSANYESGGELGSLHIDKAVNGDWLSGSVSLHPDLKDPHLKQYGIPIRIDVADYIRSRRLPILVVTLPQELNLLNELYGYGKIIRVDKLRNGLIDSSRFLRPSVTDEEQVLNSACESRLRQQQATGVPTVE